MSNIDERIVSMQFDNKQFESGAQTTMSTLDKLKQKLSFTNAAEGFADLGRAASRLDFSEIAVNLDGVTAKFSAFQSFVHGIFESLGQDVFNYGKRLVTSLTTDQISAGWNKYGEMATNVASIIAATGQSQEDVYKDLDKLNWFADETSYSLNQMTGAYSKFAAAGVDSSEAMQAIMGLATASSRAGISAGDSRFNSVLYNVAQAMGTGYLGMMDWKSLELAGVATMEFKQQLMEAGVAAGTLVKQGEKYYTVAKHTEVTAEGLRDTLSEKWIDKNTMLAGFGAYGDFVDDIYTYATEKGVTAAEAMRDLSDASETLGYKAFRSAQETKTFGEAVDATADAVSTLWMKIFQDVFGNYEEAKELWTGVGEVMYNMFAEPLWNVLDVLDVWRKYGGRTNILAGLSNAFESLKDILGAVSAAFEGLFPHIGGGLLAVWSRKFKELTERMKPTPEILDKITRAFSGVAAIFRLGMTIFSNLFGVVKKLFSSMSGGSKTILDVAAALGDYISNLVDAITQSEAFAKVFEVLGTIAEYVGSYFKTFISSMWNTFTREGGGITGVIQAIITAITQLAFKIIDLIEELTGWDLSGFTSGIAKIAKFLRETVNKVRDLFSGDQDTTFWERLKNIFTGIKDVLGPVVEKIGELFDTITGGATELVGKINLEGIVNFFKTIGGWVSSAGSQIWEFIKNVAAEIKNLDISEIIETLTGAAVGGGVGIAGFGIWQLASKIKEFIENIKGAKDKAGGGGGIKDFLDGIKNALTDFSDALSKSIKVSMILEIAVALIILAVSINMISKIDPARLTDSLMTVSLLLGEIVAVLKSLSKTDFSGEIKKAAAGMLLMAGAVYILTAAVKNLSDLSPDQIVNGMFAITVMLAELTAVTRLAKPQDLVTTGVGLIGIAVAVKILASTFKTFAEMKWEELAKGGAAVGVLLAALAGFTHIVKGKNLITTGTGLVIVAAALKILAGVSKEFATMKWEELGKAGAAIGGLLALLGGFSQIAKGGTLMASGLGMLVMAGALKIFVGVAQDLAAMKWEELGKAGAAIGGILLAIGGFSAIVANFGGGGAGFLAIGVGLLLVAAGLKVISGVVMTLATLSWDQITIGLTGIGAVLLELAVALQIAKGALSGAAALLILSVALTALLPVILVFKNMTWGEIAASLVMFAGALGVLIAAGALAGMVAPGLFALGGALALIGVGLAAAGIGVSLFATGLAVLAGLGTGAINLLLIGLQAIITTILTMLPQIATALARAVITFVTTLANGASQILSSIVTLISTILTAIVQLLPQIIETVVTIVLALLDALRTLIPEFVGFIIDIITALMETIAEKTPEFAESGADIIIAFMDAFSEQIPRVVDAGYKSMIDLINGLAEAIETNTEPLLEAVTRLCNAIIDAAKLFLETTGITDLWNAGVEIMQGLLDGIGEKVGPIVDKVKEIVGKAKDKIVEKASEWLEKGKELIQKVITGFGQKLTALKNKAKELIDGAKEAISNKVSEWLTLGQQLIQSLIDGVKAKAEEIVTAVTDVISGASDAVKKFLGIASPSKLFRGFGQYVDEGFIDGVNAYSGQVADSTSGMAQNAVDAFSQVMDGGFSLDGIQDPTIRPVMDLEGIQNGMSTMNGMFDSYAPGVTVRGTVDPTTSSSRRMYEDMMREFNRMSERNNDIQPITNNNTFNIASTDPKESAEEISRILQRQVDRRLSVWA